MKGRLILFVLVIFFSFHRGMVYAQQGQGSDNTAESEQSPLDSTAYMGGREHYLPDSPDYMAGKKHYLPDASSPKNAPKVGEGKETPSSNEETKSGESEKPQN